MRTAFLFLLLPLFSAAQLEVRKPADKFTIGKLSNVELYGLIIDSDTTYVLTFQNAKYKTLSDFQSVSFKNTGNTIEDLYKTLGSFFSEENKKNKDYKAEFKLGDTDVIASSVRTMGVTYVMFWTENGYFEFNEKQMNKIFGK